MGRAQRMDFEGGWHHVMNRGAGRRQVFFTRSDGHGFELLLHEGHDRFGVEVHAHCLMRNHFHLLLRCPNGGLSPFMQHVGSMYTRRLNQRLGRDGPIFRSRFRSLVVDSPEYLARAGRYIHRNPLDLSPPVGLASYRWSSFRCYVGGIEPPPWLTTTALLEPFGDDIVSYAAFVSDPESGRESDPARLGATIGTLLAEHGGLDGRGIERVVAAAMLDRCSAAAGVTIRNLLGFENQELENAARFRARKRLKASPELDDVVRRALDIAA